MPDASGYLVVRGWIVDFHALYDEEGVYLIDGGFLHAIPRLERALVGIGRGLKDIRAILLTHGHLDHAHNLGPLKALSGAKILAPAGEEAHVAGRYPYRGITRFCGLAEAFGRMILNYQPPEVDTWFSDGDELEFWGGLRAVCLPGHTLHHCGFYNASRKLLLCGDLFSNYLGGWPRLPPPWFNVNGAMIPQSIEKALTLDLEGVLPNHSRNQSPALHLEDLRKLASRFRDKNA